MAEDIYSPPEVINLKLYFLFNIDLRGDKNLTESSSSTLIIMISHGISMYGH